MAEYLIKSLGFGIYHVGAPTASEARDAGSQVAEVLETWTDPSVGGSHVVVLSHGFPTSLYEARIASDPEVSGSVRLAVSSSPPDSVARARLSLVSDACALYLGEQYDRSSLEA